MITLKALKTFGRIVKFLALSHSIPLEWEPLSNKAVAAKSVNFLIVWKFSIACQAFYALHNAYRLFTEIGTQPRNYLDLTVIIVWGLVATWAVIIQVSGLSKGQDMARVFNQLVKMDNDLQKKTKQDRPSEIITRIIFICTYMFVLAMMIWIMLFCAVPTNKGYLYSMLPADVRGPYAFVLFLVIELYSKWYAVVNIIWDLLFVEIQMIVSSHWITNLQRKEQSVRKLAQEYKLLDLLNTHINASHSASKIPTYLLILFVLLVMGFVGTIQFFGKMGITTYLIFPIIINNCIIISLFILVPGSKVHKASSTYVRKIRSSTPIGKVIRREAKCIRVFGVRFGFLRAIKYPHIANFLFSLSNYIFSILVAFPVL